MTSREASTLRLTIERAQPADASAAEALLDAVAEWLQSRGIDQWKPRQFGEEGRQSVAAGELYVARRGGALVGCFMLETKNPPAVTRWLREQGRVPIQGAYLARLAVAPEASGGRLGLELLNAACALAAQLGLGYLRVECWAGNERLRRYYLEAGFAHCGDVRTRGRRGEVVVNSLFERPTRMEESEPSTPGGLEG